MCVWVSMGICELLVSVDIIITMRDVIDTIITYQLHAFELFSFSVFVFRSHKKETKKRVSDQQRTSATNIFESIHRNCKNVTQKIV